MRVFVSLLFAEGVNPAEIAEQMGHSLQTLLSTYTHVIEELRGRGRESADASSAKRGDRTSHKRHTKPPRRIRRDRKTPVLTTSRRPDSNRGPLHYEGKTTRGRASTRGHAGARFPWRSGGFSVRARTHVPARARADVPVLYPDRRAV